MVTLQGADAKKETYLNPKSKFSGPVDACNATILVTSIVISPQHDKSILCRRISVAVALGSVAASSTASCTPVAS